MSYYHKRIY